MLWVEIQREQIKAVVLKVYLALCSQGMSHEGHTSPERLAGNSCSSAAVTFDKEGKSAPHASGTANTRLAVNLL